MPSPAPAPAPAAAAAPNVLEGTAGRTFELVQDVYQCSLCQCLVRRKQINAHTKCKRKADAASAAKKKKLNTQIIRVVDFLFAIRVAFGLGL